MLKNKSIKSCILKGNKSYSHNFRHNLRVKYEEFEEVSSIVHNSANYICSWVNALNGQTICIVVLTHISIWYRRS
jgi:hypothetical protein